MSWSYAELSKMAHSYGGPEEMINTIRSECIKEGITEGKASMIPWICITGVTSSLFTAVVVSNLPQKDEYLTEDECELIRSAIDQCISKMKSDYECKLKESRVN